MIFKGHFVALRDIPPLNRVQSEHLFDVMDDGTEVADPIYREDSSSTTTDRSTHHSNSDSK